MHLSDNPLLSFLFQGNGAKGPIFEDGPNFDLAFKLFHGKDGVVPLTGDSGVCLDKLETNVAPEFNPLASKAASISMSAFGPGGPFGFNSIFGKMQNKKSESSRKKEHSPKVCFLELTYTVYYEATMSITVLYTQSLFP